MHACSKEFSLLIPFLNDDPVHYSVKIFLIVREG